MLARIIIALLIISHAFWFYDVYAQTLYKTVSGSYMLDLEIRGDSINVADCDINVSRVR